MQIILVLKLKLLKSVRISNFIEISHENKASNKNKKEKTARHHNIGKMSNKSYNLTFIYLIDFLFSNK